MFIIQFAPISLPFTKQITIMQYKENVYAESQQFGTNEAADVLLSINQSLECVEKLKRKTTTRVQSDDDDDVPISHILKKRRVLK